MGEPGRQLSRGSWGDCLSGARGYQELGSAGECGWGGYRRSDGRGFGAEGDEPASCPLDEKFAVAYYGRRHGALGRPGFVSQKHQTFRVEVANLRDGDADD